MRGTLPNNKFYISHLAYYLDRKVQSSVESEYLELQITRTYITEGSINKQDRCWTEYHRALLVLFRSPNLFTFLLSTASRMSFS